MDAAINIAHASFSFSGDQLYATDKIDGGTGTDTALPNSDHAGVNAVMMNATTMINVEKLTLAAGHRYPFTTNNATVATGQTLTVDGSALGAGNLPTFNGAAETNGHFVIMGGLGAGKLTGGVYQTPSPIVRQRNRRADIMIRSAASTFPLTFSMLPVPSARSRASMQP